jgi:hypothetical protein
VEWLNQTGVQQMALSIAINPCPGASCRSSDTAAFHLNWGALGLDHQRAALMSITALVMTPDSSPAGKATRAATSSGWPIRSAGSFERSILTTGLLPKRLVPLSTDAWHGNRYCGTARNGEEYRRHG